MQYCQQKHQLWTFISPCFSLSDCQKQQHRSEPLPFRTYQLLPVHALVEVLKLQLALLLGPGVADAVGALDPLLLEGVAAGRSLVGLLSALQQDPAVHVDPQTRLHVHKRHDADVDAAAAAAG